MTEKRTYFNIILIAYLIYVLLLSVTHDEVHWTVKAGAIIMVITGLLWKQARVSSFFWIFLALILLVNLVFRYTQLSNHFFLTLYTSVAIATALLNRIQNRLLVFRYLLIIVFFFAVLQKLINPYFTDGRLIGSHLISGGMSYKTMTAIYPSNEQSVYQYDSVLQIVKETPSEVSIELEPPILTDEIIPFARAITYFILFAELMILVLLLFNRTFKSPIFHILFVAFIWGTAFFRPEYSFFSLLLILMLIAIEKPRKTPIIMMTGSLVIMMILSIIYPP